MIGDIRNNKQLFDSDLIVPRLHTSRFLQSLCSESVGGLNPHRVMLVLTAVVFVRSLRTSIY